MKMNGQRGGESLATYLMALLWVALMTACKPTERVVYVPEVHTVTTEVVTHDTVISVRIPENYVEVTSLDTLSVITLPFVVSRAVVTGGRLTHSLGTRGELPTSVRIEERIITIRDSIPYPVEVEVIREVREPLRWWQRSLMWAGVAAIAVVSVGVYRLIRRGGIAPRTGRWPFS
jgi:hypothetical protein